MALGIKFIESLELKSNDDRSIWKLQMKDKEDDFNDGILYGSVILANSLPDHQLIVKYLDETDIFTEKRIRVLEDIHNILSISIVPHVKLGTVMKLYDVYIISLKDISQEGKVNVAYPNDPKFFQGLFTMLDVIHMPYEQILVHKPIMRSVKYGGEVKRVDYNIVGLTLPTIEEVIPK